MKKPEGEFTQGRWFQTHESVSEGCKGMTDTRKSLGNGENNGHKISKLRMHGLYSKTCSLTWEDLR